MTELYQPSFWAALLEIMLINILLSGDNAMVIALACRTLPARQRLSGMIIGAGVASILRIVFTGVVATLMTLPYLKIAGAAALLWVAVRLVVPAKAEGAGHVEPAADLWRAMRIVVIADIVMSLDNVIAVAAAAKGDYLLLGFGLAMSIPIVIAGSALIMALLDRFPLLVWAGATLLGWIAGDIFATDPILVSFIGEAAADRLQIVAALLGAITVAVIALLWRRARRRRDDEV
jgi:YjbE family integral membrane protein